MRTRRGAFVVLLLLGAIPVVAQVPFPATPGWISTDLPNHSTGAAWGDINRDGWLDLVVANGNDMGLEHVVVYLNDGAGKLPTNPNWQSADSDYHGHIAIGDVNGDGYADVAVSVYIGVSGFSQKGYVKLYLNNHGTLEATPSWKSKDREYTFSCAFGDANGDGRPDLAVACGESYYSNAEQNRIYYNRAGLLDTLPAWKSAAPGYSYDVSWTDFDKDGRLDLVFANEKGPNCIYKNYGDSLGTIPIWKSSDSPEYANSLFAGDVNNDSYPDLAVSDNNQLGGSGHSKIYLNSAGRLDTLPFWTSNVSGTGSGITLADIDNDGKLDLITGGWWQPCRIYLNQGGTFTRDPQWTSSTGSVVEAIVAADVDNRALDTLRMYFVGNGARKLFTIPHAPFQSIPSVRVRTEMLLPGEYCCDRENGWVSLRTAPPVGDTIAVVAVISAHLDLAISNWDANIGNYLFMNNGPPIAVRDGSEAPGRFTLRQNYPNPFNGITNIGFEIPEYAFVSLRVFDVLGREVATVVNDLRQPGVYRVPWDSRNAASGIYFYRIEATPARGEHYSQAMLMIVVK